MSLFDVLRYPISDPPSHAELAALPYDLFNEWRAKTEWQSPGNRKTPRLIGDWYASIDLTIPRYKTERDEIKLLRKMIEKYDEPL